MVVVALVFAGFLTMLCQVLLVTPESITKDRRGNLPPPSGGIAAF
ncbi:hypothetical protein [Bosea minatitlanensis]|uniref:Uncharacterized protein n=1 Tax=Bosea minatitlanensis TaxID=128782 RepID=A0ABW0FAK9_9HYPH|nr:hypothetical protein [Bosea minatitlanensis]MCT4495545.1 hypothetical protein [Bosea minatitlanensis]